MAESETSNLPISENNSTNSKFICGVVEGFYGRPWTTEQRKELFQKMQTWGMNSYVYAPKDDYKHRAYWRELYTVEEAEHLSGLISAAHERGLSFYYALSPGLDITYSSAKEVGTLKRKLEQVAGLGCRAFALLFDDIDAEMSEGDKERFPSFAHAQVAITNEVRSALSRTHSFLLCPTQYCSTRAIPTVNQSDYLHTLGAQLSPDIDVMWTGSRVISRTLTIEGIDEIAEVLRRRPLIWDNLHANDYDQKRVFLGPYSGRSTALIPKLRGVLTNPNCEYGANFIAIHTLAQWSKCTVDADDVEGAQHINESTSSDIRLETSSSASSSSSHTICSPQRHLPPHSYHPRSALRLAIADWLPEFSRPKAAWGPLSKPQPAIMTAVIQQQPPVEQQPVLPIIPSVNTCMSVPTATTVTCTIATSTAYGSNDNPDQATDSCQATSCSTTAVTSAPLSSTCTTTTISSLPVMNSLMSESKVICNAALPNPIPAVPIPLSSMDASCALLPPAPLLALPVLPYESQQHLILLNGNSCGGGGGSEPMECGGSTPAISPTPVAPSAGMVVSDGDVAMADNSGCSGSESAVSASDAADSNNQMQMQVESNSSSDVDNKSPSSSSSCSKPISNPNPAESLLTTDDLLLLSDLFYLPFEHGSRGLQLLHDFHWLKSHAAPLGEREEEWAERAARLGATTTDVAQLMRRLTLCANRELLYDLYAYVWDVRAVVSLLDSYVQWLAGGHFSNAMASFTQGTYTWFSKGWKETFMSGEQEPWVFRGGLISDLQRLIPVDSGNDLFVYKAPDVPICAHYTVRPFRPGGSDEAAISALYAAQDYSNCITGAQTHPDLPFDAHAGAYLAYAAHMAMLVEDDSTGTIVGFACAAIDYKHLHANITSPESTWRTLMLTKYTILTSNDNNSNNKTHVATLAKAEEEEEQQQSVCPGLSRDNTGGMTLMDLLRCQVVREEGQETCPYYSVASASAHPACMTCAVLPSVREDASVSKRLVTCLLAALRANGAFGVHALMDRSDSHSCALYTRLGFTELEESVPGQLLMGRTF